MQRQRFGMKSRGQGYRRKSILSACQAHNYTFKRDKERPLPFGEKKRRTQRLPQTQERIIKSFPSLRIQTCVFLYIYTPPVLLQLAANRAERLISPIPFAFSNLISLCVSETERHVKSFEILKGVVRRRILFIFHLRLQIVRVSMQLDMGALCDLYLCRLCVDGWHEIRTQLCARGPHRRRISFFALGRCHKL